MFERTLVLIKPDAVRRGLIGEILTRYERKGLTILAMDQRQVDPALSDAHYAEHIEKPFYPALREFITGGEVIALVLGGDSAVDVVRAHERCDGRPQGSARLDPRRPGPVDVGEPRARFGLRRIGAP